MTPRSHTFPATRRLSGKLAFSAVFDAKVKESRGPLVVYARPNDLPHPRLGISISRRVGMAVKRNRIKRLLREAFRLMQHDLPVGYDLVIVVRPHETTQGKASGAMLADYRRILMHLAIKLHQSWQKRGVR
jgi:ribonuclease P protein component